MYIYIIKKDLNESYKLMGPIAKMKEFPQKLGLYERSRQKCVEMVCNHI
jgi:hypothetical protein